MGKFSRESIIEGMCLTYRHDFGLLDDAEKGFLRGYMGQIYNHNIVPLLKDLRDDLSCGRTGCEHCMIAVEKTIKEAIGGEK